MRYAPLFFGFLLIRCWSCEVVLSGRYKERPWWYAVEDRAVGLPLLRKVMNDRAGGWLVDGNLIMRPTVVSLPTDITSRAVHYALELIRSYPNGLMLPPDSDDICFVLRKRAQTLPALIDIFVAYDVLMDGQPSPLWDFLACYSVDALENALDVLVERSEICERFVGHAHDFWQHYYTQLVQVDARINKCLLLGAVHDPTLSGINLWLMQLLIMRVIHKKPFTRQEYARIAGVMRLLAKHDRVLYRAVKRALIVAK